ncbi:hypothetical protein MP638_002105 [Amoeboaphelidium occidentale]|nr:hypothetical protein MP638_002105 [Amoeboaphelidium occidentale]
MTLDLPGGQAQVCTTEDGDMYSVSVAGTPRKLILIRYDSAGSEQWRSSLDVTGGACAPSNVAYISDRVLVFGTTWGFFADNYIPSSEYAAFVNMYYASNGTLISSQFFRGTSVVGRLIDSVVLPEGGVYFLYSMINVYNGNPVYYGIKASVSSIVNQVQIYSKSYSTGNTALYAAPYARMTSDAGAGKLYIMAKSSVGGSTTFAYSVHSLSNGNVLSSGTTSTSATFPLQLVARPAPSSGFMYLTSASGEANILDANFRYSTSIVLANITTQFVSDSFGFRVNPIIFVPGSTDFFVAGNNVEIGFYDINGELQLVTAPLGSGTPNSLAWNTATEMLAVAYGSTIKVLSFNFNEPENPETTASTTPTTVYSTTYEMTTFETTTMHSSIQETTTYLSTSNEVTPSISTPTTPETSTSTSSSESYSSSSSSSFSSDVETEFPPTKSYELTITTAESTSATTSQTPTQTSPVGGIESDASRSIGKNYMGFCLILGLLLAL